MADRLEHLKKLLSDLENELKAAPQMDSETAELLARLSTEIDSALENADSSSLQESGVAGLLSSKIEAFEAAHPNLTDLVARVTNAIGQLGI